MVLSYNNHLSFRFPHDKNTDPQTSLETSLEKMSFAENSADVDSVDMYKYPANIAADIEKVLTGLMYVYTGSPLLVVPRVV